MSLVVQIGLVDTDSDGAAHWVYTTPFGTTPAVFATPLDKGANTILHTPEDRTGYFAVVGDVTHEGCRVQAFISDTLGVRLAPVGVPVQLLAVNFEA